jgi:methionyl aminopeptidase
MNDKKITAMRAGGKILAGILQRLKERVRPGANELDLNRWVEGEILAAGATVAYYEKDVRFPGAICISVNDELIHGVPEDNVLEAGDKVGFDLTIGYQGYYVDSAFSMIVGGPAAASAGVRHLLSVTESALYEGIAAVHDGAKMGDVGAAVEGILTRGKLGIVREYVGHGIGEKMHLAPEVPNYGKRGTGATLRAGDAICIEPMSSMGRKGLTMVGDDGWTVLMRDGSIGAHFEHTVLVTEDGAEILTSWD